MSTTLWGREERDPARFWAGGPPQSPHAPFLRLGPGYGTVRPLPSPGELTHLQPQPPKGRLDSPPNPQVPPVCVLRALGQSCSQQPAEVCPRGQIASQEVEEGGRAPATSTPGQVGRQLPRPPWPSWSAGTRRSPSQLPPLRSPCQALPHATETQALPHATETASPGSWGWACKKACSHRLAQCDQG